MTVLIASSFTKSLDKLTAQEQAQAKITAFDIQQNPESPGLSLHRIDRARDPNFWSARVNRDIRIVLHKANGTTLLAFVAHHDDAYDWAMRRKLDRHPRTGAAQIVEIRETVEELVIQRFVEEAVKKPRLFERESDDTLLSWGIPEEWIETVRQATDDTVLEIAEHLPDEAQEAVLSAAVGERPTVRIEEGTGGGFAHPDAKRRFRVVADQEALAAALDAPWDDWAVFLHPAQQEFVDRDFNGPARVIGSAGTGKTVVALHRAVRLAADDAESRVLLATFSTDLAEGLKGKLARLVRTKPDVATRIEVDTLPAVAARLMKVGQQGVAIARDDEIDDLIDAAATQIGTSVDPSFLKAEWRLIVDAWDVREGDRYAEIPRLGRKVRMAASRRQEVWQVFEKVRADLDAQGKTTDAALMHAWANAAHPPPYTHVVVDEAQDISAPELRFLGAIVANRTNGLFFAGDIGQRIFRSPFPWKNVGVDIQGRSRSLKVNYRTSHQIRAMSDRLLPQRLVEADGGEDKRTGVNSVFHGPEPEVHAFATPDAEAEAVGTWIASRMRGSNAPSQLAVLVRSASEFGRAERAIELSGVDGLRPALMHDAKGREYRSVVVMACDADALPLERRLLDASDETELREIYDTERHLLYVAATRARDHLWISGCTPVSEFLEDIASS